MRLPALPLLCLAALAFGLPADAKPPMYNAGKPQVCEGRHLENVGTIYFPDRGPPQPGVTPPQHRLVRIGIDAGGGLRLDGTAIAPGQLETRLASKLGRGPVKVGLYPARMAPVSAVAGVLRALNALKTCNFELVGSNLYGNMFDRKALAQGRNDVPPLAPFAKVADALLYVDYTPPVRRGKGKPGESGCRAWFNAAETNSKRLLDAMFERSKVIYLMWWNIGDQQQRREFFPPELYGGTEISGETASEQGLAPPDIFLNATIYTKAATPWMCVASTVWSAQVAGFANADVIVI